MRIRKKIRQRKGAVLALMVMVVLLLSMTSLALIRVGTEARVRTVKSDLQTTARLAADAGVERVLYLMNNDLAAGTWTAGDVPTYTSQPLPGTNADYSVSFSGDLASDYQITSTGHSNGHTRTVRATIELTSPIAKDFAVFGKNAVDMKSGSTVDGFNSGDPSDTEVPAKIGTLSTNNGAININNNVIINGNIFINPDGDPDSIVDAHSDSTINGDYFFLPSYYSLPPVSPPDYTATQGSIAGNNITLNTSDSGKYNDISIDNNGTLKINGDVTLYVTGDIELKNNAEVEVNNNAALTLYFDGDIEAKNSSGFNNKTQVPANLFIYGTGTNQQINLKNSSDLYGVIYAPNAEMIVHNSVDAYGSFIVEDFELKNSGEIYYDKALQQVSEEDELARFTVTRWEEL